MKPSGLLQAWRIDDPSRTAAGNPFSGKKDAGKIGHVTQVAGDRKTQFADQPPAFITAAFNQDPPACTPAETTIKSCKDLAGPAPRPDVLTEYPCWCRAVEGIEQVQGNPEIGLRRVARHAGSVLEPLMSVQAGAVARHLDRQFTAQIFS